MISVCLRLAEYSPWKDERELFRQKAMEYFKKSMTLPRPLTVADCGYIDPQGKAKKLAKNDRKRVLSLIQEWTNARA